MRCKEISTPLCEQMAHLKLQLGDALAQQFFVGHGPSLMYHQHHQQLGRCGFAGGASSGSSSSSTGSRGFADSVGADGGSGVGIAGAED
jgi:hypothetical protein